MDEASVNRLVNSVQYEGYLLYPYRASLKNNLRWTFGGLYPREWSVAAPGRDRWQARTDFVVAGSEATSLAVEIRFLHVVDRTIFSHEPGEPRVVRSLEVDQKAYHSGQECTERQFVCTCTLAELLDGPICRELEFPGHEESESIVRSDGELAGTVLRRQAPLRGSVEIRSSKSDAAGHVVRLSIANHSEMQDLGNRFPISTSDEHSERAPAVLHVMASTHALVRVRNGQFISLLDPTPEHKLLVAACQSEGLWPVLIGDAGQRDILLCSPIILYDYPALAPESHGDFFDATEIDEMLTLRVLTLSDDERRAVASFDARGRALLERTHALAESQLSNLDTAARSLRRVEE